MNSTGCAVAVRGVLLLQWLLLWRLSQADHPIVTISRQHKGDMFTAEGSSCSKDACVGSSSGTAGMAERKDCACQCLPHLPVFREDLHICIDDIHECSLAPFVSGSTTQKIPFVFLPLKGQIVYPSAEINFDGVETPICVVSGAQFLTRGGWVDLHNNSYTEPPFRLFRDEGRTFLQWLGEVDLRFSMEGRLMLVHLMCKDVGSGSSGQDQSIFTPCVAFRVAGTPSVREWPFAADAHASGDDGRGLSVTEYIAIAVCSILLGLIYVASVFLYLHVRRRRRREVCPREKESRGPHLAGAEEGIVKSNPLLGRHHAEAPVQGVGYLSDSASCCSDTDAASDIGPPSDDSGRAPQNVQVTSALVHLEPLQTQESGSIERLPEENVSIVETLEAREERPETVRAIANATIRRKLYFNPAYFEPELLAAPPPAAIEFLTKIREVIAIAKHKMLAKRFSPTLLGIPEEEQLPEGSRRCSGCPGCGGVDSLPEPCKQSSIRKWLEDVPTAGEIRKKGRAPPAPVKAVNPAVVPPPPPPPTKLKQPAPCPPPPPLPPLTTSEPSKWSPSKERKKEPPTTKRLMDAVIQELVGQRGLEAAKDPDPPKSSSPEDHRRSSGEEYEADSLERGPREGMSTPTDYGEVSSSQPSPTLSSALPLEEVLTMRNEIFNVRTGSKTISKLRPPTKTDDHEYEVIVLNPELYSLPELLHRGEGYSLVSEVYVNDSFGSAPSSSASSSPKIRYSEKPGHLTIQVEDSPDNYLPLPDDSDSFEPDTLDRKPKHKQEEPERRLEQFNDSLERPAQILLRTTGSFRSDSMSQAGSDDLSQVTTACPLSRAFGSLREIYEARTQLRGGDGDTASLVGSTRSLTSELDYTWRRTLEAKQARRQRPPTPPGSYAPPLPPKANSVYEDPPPPRPLYKIEPTPPLPPRAIKPPLPPKNGAGRSTRTGSDPARRPLPPLPPTNVCSASTAASQDVETLSNKSGASVDSLNSSDYETFYMTPFSGDEEQDGSQTLGHRLERSLKNKFSKPESQTPAEKPPSDEDLVQHMRDKSADSVKKTWRRMVQKPEDSGYLSTDSNDSGRRAKQGQGQGSVSETDESLCDGASESGAESIATDSFFFGSFRKLSTCAVVTESVDSGVGSELVRTMLLDDAGGGSSSDSENVSLVTVLPPGSCRRRSLRC